LLFISMTVHMEEQVVMNKQVVSLIAATGIAVALAVPAARADMGPGMPPAELITNGPQASPGDGSASWSAQRNVVESHQYEQLLRANPGFRQARMNKECGPIDDPAMRQQCVASFR
jgi:hypothetical protein